MKYFSVIILLILSAEFSKVSAQTSSIRLGTTFSNIKIQQNSTSVSNTRRMGIMVGYIYNESISNSLTLRSEAIITSRGENFEFEDGNEKLSGYEQNYYLNIPLTLKFTIPTSLKIKPFLSAGLYAGFGVGGKWESDYYENDELITNSKGDVLYRPIISDDDLRPDVVYKDMMDVGYLIGLGVELNKWAFEISVSNGLKDISPNYSGDLISDFPEQYNRSFSGSLIYTFVKSDVPKQRKKG